MKRILFVLALLCTFLARSQNIHLQGTVKDSVGAALEMANVMAINKATKAMDSYAITNDAGKYQLLLKADTEYIIKSSYIGYTPYEITITTGKEDILQHIVLKQGVELAEVEIVHEMPVTIKGDTIVYNADSFTNGSERKLGDVLKKLPGVEVNEDGEFKV